MSVKIKIVNFLFLVMLIFNGCQSTRTAQLQIPKDGNNLFKNSSWQPVNNTRMKIEKVVE